MNLWPHQREALTAIWNDIQDSQTALCVSATGSGKSRIIAALLEKSIAAKPDIKCLVLFNRVTLLKQQADGLKELLPDSSVSIYCGTAGEWDLSGQVVVGSIQSLDPDHLNFNLIIVDETHALNEEKGRYIEFLKHQMNENPRTRVVGFTASPYNYSGYIYGKNKFYKRACYDKGIKYFVDKGFLVTPIAKRPEHQIDVSKLRVLKGEYRQDDVDAQTMNLAMAKDQVIDALNRSEGRQKIVWACASINHAELIKSILLNENEDAVTLHSKMEWSERNLSEDKFRNGSARHLTFVTVISEGYDQRNIDCVVLMRPTKSPTLFVQTVGRGLRISEGKTTCLVLDYANVVSTLGPLEAPVIQKKGKGSGNIEPSQKSCPECRTYVAPRTMLCPDCGYNWPKADALKLNLTADENVSFFKKSIKTMQVNNVRLSHHISRNGNESYKLSYMPPGIFLDAINEYFPYKTVWGMRKFMIRAYELGIQIKEDPYEQVKERASKIPVAIEYFLSGKYPEVQRLVYDEIDGNRA
jgi:DNA repair protein RadD